MTENNKKLVEASLKEVSDTYRESRWNNDISYTNIRKYLGVNSMEDALSIADVISNYKHHVIGAVFDEFLEKNGYKIERQFSSDDTENLYPYAYESIEVRYKVNKNIIDDGKMFISKGDLRLVFSCRFYSHEEYKLDVFVENKNEKIAEKFLKDLKDYAINNNYLKNQKITPDFSFIEIDKKYTWDSVILNKKTKDKIFSNLNVILNNLDVYAQNNIAFKRGIIFKGVPGVGKTLIGKILCNITNITLLWVTPKHLDRSSNVAMIGELARELSPVILFLEDIDLYGSSRDLNGNKTLLGELMNQLDGIEENKNVIVVATTNRSDELEDALRNRPGRFDVSIEIPLPDIQCRKEMLELYLKRFTTEKLDIEKIAEATQEYTGAHIKDLVDLAVMTAIDEGSLDKNKKIVIKQEHLDKNIKLVKKRKIEISSAFQSDKKDSRSLNIPTEEY